MECIFPDNLTQTYLLVVPIIHAVDCSETTRVPEYTLAPTPLSLPPHTWGILQVIATNGSDLMVHLLPIYLPTIRHPCSPLLFIILLHLQPRQPQPLYLPRDVDTFASRRHVLSAIETNWKCATHIRKHTHTHAAVLRQLWKTRRKSWKTKFCWF